MKGYLKVHNEFEGGNAGWKAREELRGDAEEVGVLLGEVLEVRHRQAREGDGKLLRHS